MKHTFQARLRLSTACRAGAALIVAALLAAGSSPASAADNRWVGNDAFNNSNFSASGNWQNNTLPTWSSSNSLIFTQNLNANVTGLVYDLTSGWSVVDDIKWAETFPVARTLSSSNGNGLDFRVRMENLSSFTQTVTLNTSGGKNGANEIQLNPVNGSLILSGTIYNDNSVDYVVWGSLSSTTTNLTLNTALGPNATQANVDFTVSGGRNSAIQVNASQVWSGTTTVNSGAFTTANGVTLASSAIVVAGGTVASTSANTFADTATLTVNSGRLSVGGSDTVASLAGSGGSVDLASGATLTAGNAGSTSYAGSITGSGGFTKVGSGTFTLSAASSYTGTTTVSAGRLSLAAANLLADSSAVTGSAGAVFALGGNETIGSLAGSLDVALGSSTLTVGGNGQSTTYSGGISGSGGLTKSGSGTLTLSGSNSYSGGTTVSGGRLVGTTANLQGAITNNAAVEFAQDTSGTYAGSMTGSGSLTKTGTGTMTLSGSNSYAGGSIVSAGRLVGTTATLQGAIANDAAVEFAQATSGTYAGSMTGSGSLTKSGAGVVTLTGSSGFTGGAALNAGTLAVGSANALGSAGTISFGGGTLQYSGSNTTDYSGRFSNAAGQQYSIDSNGQAVTLAANLTSSGGSFTKLGSGSVTLSGSNSYSGGTVVSAGRLIGTTVSLQGAITNNAEVAFDQATSGTYAGAMNGSGTLVKLGVGTVVLTANNSLTGGATISQGTLQIGNGAAAVNLSGPRAIASGARLLISNTAYSLTAGWSTITGAGTLELDGGSAYGNWGSVALPSGFTGTLQVDNAGRFDVSGTSSLGNASALTIQAGAQMLVTSNFQTFPQALSIAGFGSEPNWNYGALRTYGNGTVFTGPVTLTGNAGLLTQNHIGASSMTISGNIGDGGAGYGLTIRGAGGAPITLSGSNSYSGDTLVTADTLNIGGRFALAGSTLDTSGAGSFALTAAGTNTYVLGGLKGPKAFAMGANSLEVGGNGQSTTYSGILSGSGGFSKVGNGTLTLSGSNSYTGGTTISGGRIVGTTASIQGAITNDAAVTFDMATSGTYAGRMTGSGSLTKTGAGTLTLSNTTVYTGPTALDGGVIALASINALQATSTISFGGGTLQYSANNTLDYSDRFSTAPGQQYRIDTNGQNVSFMRSLTSAGGSFVKLGAGYLQFSGTNSYSGGTTVSAGELSGRIYSLQGDILNNAAVRFVGSDAGSYVGAMSGTGALYTQIAGELVLAGTNTYSGGTFVLPGSKIRGSTSGVQGAIQNSGVVEFAQATSGTYSGVMSGTGTVTKSGAGILAMTAANTSTGLTSVVDGGLKLNGSIAGGLSVAAIASLSGTGTVGGNATIAGTHSPGNSPGIQTFNADLTYEAGALVNWELIANTTGSAGVNYDQLILPNGNLTFSGSTTLALSFNGPGSTVDWSDAFWNVDRAWTLYDLSSGSTSNLSNLILGGSLLDSANNPLSPTERGYFTTSLSGQDVMLNFVAVPEPSTYCLAVAGLAAAGFMIRRRRRS